MSLAARVVADRLRAGEVVRWTVRGASMWPIIPDGSVVEATPCGAIALREGDIAAYARADTVVVHRLVARRGDALLFRGDSLCRADVPVPGGAVLGRVRVVERAGVRWSRPRRQKLLGALRLALALARAVKPPSAR